MPYDLRTNVPRTDMFDPNAFIGSYDRKRREAMQLPPPKPSGFAMRATRFSTNCNETSSS